MSSVRLEKRSRLRTDRTTFEIHSHRYACACTSGRPHARREGKRDDVLPRPQTQTRHLFARKRGARGCLRIFFRPPPARARERRASVRRRRHLILPVDVPSATPRAAMIRNRRGLQRRGDGTRSRRCGLLPPSLPPPGRVDGGSVPTRRSGATPRTRPRARRRTARRKPPRTRPRTRIPPPRPRVVANWRGAARRTRGAPEVAAPRRSKAEAAPGFRPGGRHGRTANEGSTANVAGDARNATASTT